MKEYPAGSAHGRFQPLHLGHMEYLLASIELFNYLWIGITQYNIRSLSGSLSEPHRIDPASNPLTFFERVELITEALEDNGISRLNFSIIPFPIDTPQVLHDFLPTSIPITTTIYEEWNKVKITTLNNYGYKTIVLWERNEKKYRGIDVREKILRGDETWRDLVPPASIKFVEKNNIRNRLIKCNEGINYFQDQE